MMNLPTAGQTIPCRECSAGQMHLRHVTYYAWLAEELITVSDFPAWVCDVCGRREYDPQSLSQLSLLLSPNAGQSPRRHRTMRRRRQVSKPKSNRPTPTDT